MEGSLASPRQRRRPLNVAGILFFTRPILVGVAGNVLHLPQIRASPPLHGRPAEQGLRLELAGEHSGYVPMIHPYTFPAMATKPARRAQRCVRPRAQPKRMISFPGELSKAGIGIAA